MQCEGCGKRNEPITSRQTVLLTPYDEYAYWLCQNCVTLYESAINLPVVENVFTRIMAEQAANDAQRLTASLAAFTCQETERRIVYLLSQMISQYAGEKSDISKAIGSALGCNNSRADQLAEEVFTHQTVSPT